MFKNMQTNVVIELKYKVAPFMTIVHYMAHQINLVMRTLFVQSSVGKLEGLL
jgi:hypothetical protein